MHVCVVPNRSLGQLINFRGSACGADHATGSRGHVLVPFLQTGNSPSTHPLGRPMSHSIAQPGDTRTRHAPDSVWRKTWEAGSRRLLSVTRGL